ncbi:MAG: HlyD family efflux transporter periplasmic adaptor subunit [Proteobacteria bacterium]|nr:HlyD family efflux transporter periplasmic adaptor subunit [Pseudomonadota bacterium]
MNKKLILPTILLPLLAACSGAPPEDMGAAVETEDYERGPNNGRMLRGGDFAIELAIVEAGVPPEFRAWATVGGQAVDPRDVNLNVTLTRLGNRIDEHEFRAQGDFLRGSSLVYDPHSFADSVDAVHDRRSYRWDYDSFEGRTRIGPEMAEAFGLGTETAGPAVIEESVTLYGRIVPNTDRVRAVSARFNGAIRSVHVMPGESVTEGQLLATVESNESLQSYPINAPIAGVVTERVANPGEQTAGRQLFTIVDTSSVWAELAVFPGDRDRILPGSQVIVTPASGGAPLEGAISYLDVFSAANQSVNARVVLDNSAGSLTPGTFVTAEVRVAEHEVPLAVRRSALQTFRDFTVVYAQIGDEYEVRMLELGRAAGDWVEVLGGLDPGTRYVTENSYVLKADIEKSGATHDH